jgi:hypothetical protein
MAAALADYERSATEFRARAERVARDAWDRPRAEGKWSPAQEVEHIVLSHELFLSQLGGGPEMRVVVKGWRLIPLRWLVLPYILRTGRFPRARAPRESRPVASGATPAQLFARLDAAVRGVAAMVSGGDATMMSKRLRHPYFGMLSVPTLVRLSTVHTRHHTANMPRAASA